MMKTRPGSRLRARAILPWVCLLGLVTGCQSPGAHVAAEHRVEAERALADGNYARALAAAEQAVVYNPAAVEHHDLVNRVKLTAVASSTVPVRVQDGESLAYVAEAMSKRDAAQVHIYQTALGRLRLLLGEPEEARVAFDAAIEHQPDYWPASLGLATYLEQRGDLDGAVQKLRASYQANPELTHLEAQLGQLLVRAGKPAEASKILSAVVAREPSAAAHIALARAMVASGHQQMAGAEFEKAVVLEARSVGARVAFAEWLTSMGQYQAATQQYDSLNDLGKAPLGRLGKGIVLLEQGQPKEALISFQHALEGDPKLVGVKYHAARAHEKLGNTEPARQLYEAYVAEAGSQAREQPSVEKARARLAALARP